MIAWGILWGVPGIMASVGLVYQLIVGSTDELGITLVMAALCVPTSLIFILDDGRRELPSWRGYPVVGASLVYGLFYLLLALYFLGHWAMLLALTAAAISFASVGIWLWAATAREATT